MLSRSAAALIDPVSSTAWSRATRQRLKTTLPSFSTQKLALICILFKGRWALEVDKITCTGLIDEFLGQLGRDSLEAGDVRQVIQDVAWMTGSELAS
jgi:hypothetical protein